MTCVLDLSLGEGKIYTKLLVDTAIWIRYYSFQRVDG